MAQIEIPEVWRNQVCAILATEATDSLIEWKYDAEIRYEADATAAKMLAGDNDPAWRYEYGKILLRPDRKRVVIFSAHRPLKPKLSCE